MTRAPLALASCVSSSPTPPAAACTTTVSPGWTAYVEFEQVVRGHPLQQRAGGDVVRQGVGHRHGRRRADDHLLRVAPRPLRPRDPLAEAQVRHIRTDGRDDAASLGAEHERRGHRVQAGSLIDVGEVDACRSYVYPDLAGPWLRDRPILDLENLGPAGLGDDHCAHDPIVARRPG